MVIFFCFKSKEINNFFLMPLLNSGYQASGFTEVPKLLEYMEKNEVNLLIIDYDDFCEANEDNLAKIRLLSEKVQIILITMYSSFKIKNLLTKYRIYGIIDKPVSYPKLLDHVRDYIELLGKKLDKNLRQYPRLVIKNEKQNIIRLTFTDLNKSYLGSVQDISLGGLGVNLKKDASKYVIFTGKKLNARLELSFLKIDFKGVVVNFNGKNKIGISFKEISPHNLVKIKEFILSLMIEENKKTEVT